MHYAPPTAAGYEGGLERENSDTIIAWLAILVIVGLIVAYVPTGIQANLARELLRTGVQHPHTTSSTGT